MPVVTSIKLQKLKKRVNVFLDNKFGFGLDLENFIKLELKVGKELSEEEIVKITHKAEFQKVLDRLLFFATLRPRSEKEISDWMTRKKVNDDIKDGLFKKLEGLELVNDVKFSEWWIDQRKQFKYRSRRELIQELKFKGIQNSVIEEILSREEIDDVRSAKKLVEKNSYKWIKFPKNITRQKISSFLARKGFGWETIRKVLDNRNWKN